VDNDDRIRSLNRLWRRIDKPTNVLSFPAPDSPAGPTSYVGDIAISYETAAREAAAEGKSFSDHVAHLSVHGFLHLMGYDHESDADAAEMEGLEREILAHIGIPDPYIANDA
jgi:probable rRNA maturation factor